MTELLRRAATDNPIDALRERVEAGLEKDGIDAVSTDGVLEICFSSRYVGARDRARALLGDLGFNQGEWKPATIDRDVERRKILAAIADAWSVGPDLSLGELLAVVLHDVERLETLEDESAVELFEDFDVRAEIRRLQNEK